MSDIINWDSVFFKKDDFQKKELCKFTFIENFFQPEFYERLYETFPKSDDGKWISIESDDKSAFRQFWNSKTDEIVSDKPDPAFSDVWNEFYHYLHSDECISKFREFSGVPITKLRHYAFMLLKQGGYQMAHCHNVGPSTLIIMPYFCKNWEHGDPGGTYISTTEDESKIDFEPYNLDNSAIIFHDGPYAGHGVRRIEKDVERKAAHIYYEEFSDESGWSGDKKFQDLVEL